MTEREDGKRTDLTSLPEVTRLQEILNEAGISEKKGFVWQKVASAAVEALPMWRRRRRKGKKQVAQESMEENRLVNKFTERLKKAGPQSTPEEAVDENGS